VQNVLTSPMKQWHERLQATPTPPSECNTRFCYGHYNRFSLLTY